MASVMFTDVADSSALVNLVGERVWMRRIGDHFDAVRKTVEELGGTLVKSLGNGTMSTFKTARSAVNAAQSIQRAAIASTIDG